MPTKKSKFYIVTADGHYLNEVDVYDRIILINHGEAVEKVDEYLDGGGTFDAVQAFEVKEVDIKATVETKFSDIRIE
jgi:hypothetical protein